MSDAVSKSNEILKLKEELKQAVNFGVMLEEKLDEHLMEGYDKVYYESKLHKDFKLFLERLNV